MRKNKIVLLSVFILCSVVGGMISRDGLAQNSIEAHPEYMKNQDYQGYMEFFKEVYKTMVENYYLSVDQENLNKFLYVFNTRLYPQYKLTGSSSNFIKWRSAAYLVEALRAPDDIFSALYPPKEATKYETEALGKKIDLGVEGKLTKLGYEVTRVEPRSDAFAQGLREKDVILKIESQDVKAFAEDKIQELLTPLENSKVSLEYQQSRTRLKKKIWVLSKEYFKQTVFLVPVDVPHVYCLQLPKFNQATSEDMTTFMNQVLSDKEIKGLIIDMRGNPGGPPLAAREISGFFLPPKEEFSTFQKKNRPPAVLDVPELPKEYQYAGSLVILVDKKSGSAAELFSGVLQSRHRAVLMGTNTAGQVFLKSMFYLTDGSMVLLVTARGHKPDGTVFSFDGVVPDEKVDETKIDLIKYAADYLVAEYAKTNQAKSKDL